MDFYVINWNLFHVRKYESLTNTHANDKHGVFGPKAVFFASSYTHKYCIWSSDPFYIVIYYIKWGKTSRTDNTVYGNASVVWCPCLQCMMDFPLTTYMAKIGHFLWITRHNFRYLGKGKNQLQKRRNLKKKPSRAQGGRRGLWGVNPKQTRRGGGPPRPPK